MDIPLATSPVPGGGRQSLASVDETVGHFCASGATREEMSDLFDGPPLSSIDWGTQLDVARVDVRPVPDGTTLNIDGMRVVTSLWTPYERGQFELAFRQIEAVTALDFAWTENPADAEFRLAKYADEAPCFCGAMYPPGTEYEGLAVFNYASYGWDWNEPGRGGLEQGGLGFSTILHEFGHGLGLAHPHDTGGSSTVMPGVTERFDSYGTGDLNQGVFTVMGFNDGWPGGPPGLPPLEWPLNYGYQGTLMALDIAVLQEKYGANTDHAAGNDVYRLPETNGLGTYYSSIWDTGGVDEIRTQSSRDAVIDLRAATLEQETGGGGFVSYVSGIYGGMTIANGVIIETATGGSGNDVITGNAAANTLVGRRGNDILRGNDGDDVLRGGDGLDRLFGGLGDDAISGGATPDDRSDVIQAGAGDDWVDAGHGNDTIEGGAGDDQLIGGFGADSLAGQSGADILNGGPLSDFVLGGDGEDFVNGGFGYDRINGGGGDSFYHLGVADHGSDWIQDFSAVEGDRLVFGDAGRSVEDFTLRFTHTASPEGVRSGADDVEEAFVIYQPAGLIVWALVDGAGQAQITLEIGGALFDLLA